MKPPVPPLTAEQRARIDDARGRMMKRARAKGWAKQFSYLLQAALAFPLVGLLALLPLDAASAFGGWIGRAVVYRLLNRGEHYRTMRVAFPDNGAEALDGILKQMCENIGRVLGETAHLADFGGTGNPRLRVTGVENLVPLREAGVPILFLSGHFGNWELVPVALRSIGIDGISVVQHPNNPFVLRWIAERRYRAGLGGQVAAEEGVYAALRRQLKARGCAAILTDQRVLNGIKAPFFGVETMSNLIPARLARDLGAAVVPMTNRRVGGAHFEIAFEPPLTAGRTEDREADERALTARINRFYETQILAEPAGWLWGHPRFDDALGLIAAAPVGDESSAGTD